MVLVSVALAFVLSQRDAAELEPRDLLGIGAGVFTAYAALAFLTRKQLTANAAGRRLVGVVALCCLVMVTHRAFAWIGGQAVPMILSTDLWVLAGMTGAAGILVRPWFGLVGAIFGVAAAVASIVPSLAVPTFSISAALGFLVVTLGFLHVERGGETGRG